MGYPENTSVSPVGQQLLNDIFDLIYLQSEDAKNKTTRMINNSSQMPEVVQNFKTNAARIVTLMKRFMKGNTHINRADAGDSGVFVCNPLWLGFDSPLTPQPPANEVGCGRRDHLWWWEWLDFGVYDSYTEWGSSIGLNTWPHNYVDSTWDQGQVIVARLRCNTVNTCDAQDGGCGTTWHGSSECPNPVCTTKRKTTVGCGKTSYAIFHTKVDKPVSSYWTFSTGPQFRNGAPVTGAISEMPRNTVSIIRGSSAADDSSASKFFYRFYWQGLPPVNTYLSTFNQCLMHIPYIQIGYRSLAQQDNTRPCGYTCNECEKERFAPPWNESSPLVWNNPFDIHTRLTAFTASSPQWQGDQHGGLCKNIGDVPGTYAGLSGTFGCICGGIYEPNLKVNAIPDEDMVINNALIAAGETTISGTTTGYGSSVRATAGSGRTSNMSIYGRGSVDDAARKAVMRQYGSARVTEATIAVQKVKAMQIMRRNNAFPFTVPLSKMRYSFVHSPLKICKNPAHPSVTWRNPSTGENEIGSNFQPLIHSSTGEVMDYCPQCGITGDAKFITMHPQKWLAPARPLTITSSQPLTRDNTMGVVGVGGAAYPQTFLERPQWTLVLRDLTDEQERYNIRLELPQAYIGDIIPSAFTPQPPPPTSANRPEGFTCPNERQGPLAAEMIWLQNLVSPTVTNITTEDLQDNELLVISKVTAGDEEVMVSNPERANATDYITGGPFGVGTQIINIDGNKLTLNTPAQTVRGTARDARGVVIDVTEFEPPFAIRLVRNDTSANPLLPTCCNGVQSNQYTFLVTEGKSASGFYSRPARAWVDTSPLVNYGDRKGLRWTEVDADAARRTNAIHTDLGVMQTQFRSDITPESFAGVSGDSIRTGYMELPSPILYGDEYQWCDLDSSLQNQMVQDMFANANRMLRAVLIERGGGSNYQIEGSHTITLVEEEEIPQSGLIVKSYKCRTCESIANIGQAAIARGTAATLIEALQNETYYPGYAAIRYYQQVGQMERDNRIIQSDNTIEIKPTLAGRVTQGYLEGAVEWEKKNLDGNPPSWYNWAIRFRTELAEGGDYRYN